MLIRKYSDLLLNMLFIINYYLLFYTKKLSRALINKKIKLNQYYILDK